MQLGFREHERQRHANDIHAKHSVIIQALRDLGWVRQHTLDVITDPSQPQPFNTPSLPRFQRVSVNAMERTTRRLRHAATVHELRGQTIFVDRSGNAFLGITNQDEFNRGRISRWNAIHRPSKKRFNIHRPINFKPTVRAAKHLEYQHTHLEARQGQDRRRRQKKRDLIAALEKLGWVRNGQLTDVPLSNQGADVDR
jgi:hypothetical protein